MSRYVIIHGPYFGIEPRAEEFEGTYRQMLMHVYDVTEDTSWDTESGPKVIADLTTLELRGLVDQMNGDGCAEFYVYDLDSKELVI